MWRGYFSERQRSHLTDGEPEKVGGITVVIELYFVGLCLTMFWLLLARRAYFPRHLG